MEEIINKINKNKQELVFTALLITSIKMLVLIIQSVIIGKNKIS